MDTGCDIWDNSFSLNRDTNVLFTTIWTLFLFLQSRYQDPMSFEHKPNHPIHSHSNPAPIIADSVSYLFLFEHRSNCPICFQLNAILIILFSNLLMQLKISDLFLLECSSGCPIRFHLNTAPIVLFNLIRAKRMSRSVSFGHNPNLDMKISTQIGVIWAQTWSHSFSFQAKSNCSRFYLHGLFLFEHNLNCPICFQVKTSSNIQPSYSLPRKHRINYPICSYSNITPIPVFNFTPISPQ